MPGTDGSDNLKIEHVPVCDLHVNPRNPRDNDRAVDAVARSIQTFGFNNPIITDGDLRVCAGHTRLRAAVKLGLATVPVLRIPALVGNKFTGYSIADNRTAEIAEWDIDVLRELVCELNHAPDFDLGDLAFPSHEIDKMLAANGNGTEDDVPDAPTEPVTRRGDLWLLGEHRLLCGDATVEADVTRAVSGDPIDCVFTSLPYGVGIDYGEYQDTIENLRVLLLACAKLWKTIVVSGGFAVVNFGDIAPSNVASGANGPCEYPMALDYWPPFRSKNWVLWSRRAWCKPNPRVHSPWCMQSNRAATDWEHIWTWKHGGRAIVQRSDGMFPSAVGWFDTSRLSGVDVGKGVHGAGMPVSTAQWMLHVHSRAKSLVCDPFLGTGTTMIAAEKLGRRCIAIEIEPKWCDVAVERWRAFTGGEPQLIRAAEVGAHV